MIGLLTPVAAGGPVLPTFSKPSSCVQNNGLFCWSWFSQHWGGTFAPALWQYLLLVVIAVVVGFIVSMAFALVAYRRRWFQTPASAVFTFLYTVPSIALFELLVPATGLTRLTAEIALCSYMLYVMFSNFVTGLRGVPPDVLEAAEGMGLTRFQQLRRVELPLAIPAIMAGVRIATVTAIGLAAIAAYVDNEGLGSLILDAIDRQSFKTELIGASVLIVLLSFVLDAILVVFGRAITPWQRGVRRA